ncbi:hypothetical protein Murru_0445 [Allomuricauda ruestringensis DSM 13258]|uniref:Uncharacterized protein n=1 Tax=Allomuricauda ruestringensis (strain DSM 13258 / CIP 107369 / LMG 19739 / B1) TaxID=886377 RepID=G2PRQ0_ALLRU|nr:hypothetical protein [Allomuricauda ruestringensis]AEM69499.1 hypothetical protein Murru_0445 [Allomuricauda ruestringensis DSM 13258]
MRELNSILNKITVLTHTMESQYPELYHFLDEDPITLPVLTHPNVDKDALEDYLQSLHELLEHHVKTHNYGIHPVQKEHQKRKT